ncbi:hypothetical protein [Parahaliea mediterranea]|uniref:Uncharacterized protein n=1 Tax=Parahaliea mediterranea TaxID=651086 RepID=A0A939IMQ2_9GAMM|nr:hypothetical protein [Parahaliea mediterranea]MBN7797760.1 hypothetical protein [Parahaliea mediterranea]
MPPKQTIHHNFMSYDPFTDERIDPPTSDGLYAHPDLTNSLHVAVARAKALIGPIDSETLNNHAHLVEKMVREGRDHLAMAPEDENSPLYRPLNRSGFVGGSKP